MKTYSEKAYLPNFKNQSWAFEKVGARGFGKNGILIQNMDKYLPKADLDELHYECCMGLAAMDNVKIGMFGGAIPPFEVDNFDGVTGWSEVFRNLEQYDPTGDHRKNIEKIYDMHGGQWGPARMQIYKYIYYAIGGPVPWFYLVYILKGEFSQKTQVPGKPTQAAKYFSKTLDYIYKLPLKMVGRALFFTTYPNAGVTCHRDAPSVAHKDHNINLFFCSGRPSYIYNEITEERTYLDPEAKSYFCNNRDYHGVDPEPRFRYTLRIDGVFEDWLQEELGMEDGYTWREEYESR